MPNPLKLMMGSAGVAGAGGTLWGWGYAGGNKGTLGDGTSINRSSPVQIGTDTWLYAQSAYYVTTAIKSDNTLWTWGKATDGALGNNTVTPDISSPVQVGTDTDWSSLSGGKKRTLAIKTDGTLWSWGNNTLGELGVGDTNNRSSPVQIGSLTTWSKVGAGETSTHAIKTDGTLWAWGKNSSFGELGDGTTINRSSPVQIGALTTWTHANSGKTNFVGRTSDGKIWAAGWYNYGILTGDDLLNSVSRSSPVQVGDLTDWTGSHLGKRTAFGIKSDGTLWAWGYNVNGEMGILIGGADNSPFESPVQVGALTNWSNVPFSSDTGAAAVKSDGTLWNWGRKYQIGDSNFINRSSPVQIGSLTTWSKVGGGVGQVFFAIKTS